MPVQETRDLLGTEETSVQREMEVRRAGGGLRPFWVNRAPKTI